MGKGAMLKARTAAPLESGMQLTNDMLKTGLIAVLGREPTEDELSMP